jgi:uncharacterized LabA/DUF88 family protein
MLNYSGTIRPKPRKYLFIDGAYFKGLILRLSRRFGDNVAVPIRYDSLGSGFDRVIYYDALPARKENQTETEYKEIFEAKYEFLNSVRRCRNFHVRDGVTRLRSKSRTGIEQKGVDTWIAIDALTYAFQGTIDVAEVITGDLDLYPLFEALLQTNTKGILRFDPANTSDELIMAADQASAITSLTLLEWAEPDFQRHYRIDQSGPRIDEAPLVSEHRSQRGLVWVRHEKTSGNWQATFEGIGNYFITKHKLLLVDKIKSFTSDPSIPDSIVYLPT